MAVETLSFDCEMLNKNGLFVKTLNDIKSYSKDIVENYLKLGKSLKNIKDDKLYELVGYTSVYEFSEKELNFSQTVTKNLIAVYEKFADKERSSAVLKKEYENFNYTQLVELVPVDENELNDYNPEMTTKEIRYKKIETKIKSDLNKLIKFTKEKLYEEMDKLAKNSELKYSLKIEEPKYDWDPPVQIVLKTMSGLGYEFEVCLGKKNGQYSYEIRTYDYKYFEVDTSISLVLKYLKEFINKVLPSQKSLLEKKDEETKQKMEEKKKNKELGIEEVKSRFKNNSERENFLNDLNNYELLYDLPLLKRKYYQCKDYPDIVVLSVYLEYCQDYRMVGYYLYKNKEIGMNYSTSFTSLVEYLKDKKE